MMRPTLIAIAFLGLAGSALASASVALRTAPTATGDTVTLADVFEGVTGPGARLALAPAPGPGLNAVLDAGRVQLAARQAGFDWANDLNVRRIVVASATSPAAGSRSGAARVAARAQALAYTRNIAAGEIVQAGDLMWSDEAVAGPNAPGDPGAVIGQAAKRPLRSGAAVQTQDVAAPVAVHRDETISVAYETAGISLVLQGKALKDAAFGESVQVLNPQSKKVIEAVVAGPGRAVVGPRAEAIKSASFSTASLR